MEKNKYLWETDEKYRKWWTEHQKELTASRRVQGLISFGFIISWAVVVLLIGILLFKGTVWMAIYISASELIVLSSFIWWTSTTEWSD